MTNSSLEAQSDHGVYYAKEAYAGFWRRLMAWVIDTIVLLLIITLFTTGYYYLPEFNPNEVSIYFWVTFICCYLYLTVIKTSERSTIGFNLAKIKIVDLKGEKPSLFIMTARVCFLIALGPLTSIIDFMWLTGEKTKQTLRDKYIGTYVIKRDYEPIGTGKIVRPILNFLGWNLLYKEVVIPENE